MADENLMDLKKTEAIINLERALKNFDWDAHEKRVGWSLDEPLCCCDDCYSRWLELGKELYKNNTPAYEERKQQALSHLRNKQLGRKIDEEKRAKRIEGKYLCSAA